MQTVPDTVFIAVQTALAGQYSLERELGRGGMGIVYLAREVRLDRSVALKVLPPDLAARPELRARFLREARTAAKLSHPHIVPIFQVDQAGDFVFFVMAYIDGETLGQRVRARGALPPGEVARILREVAWALAYAHARGIVHRDVKPDNILLEQGTGRALVTDFGIAHVGAASALTEAGQVMGTAQYMSPEQASGEPLDGRSDLYSLGVVGYLALTGRLPFDSASAGALLAMHLTQPAPPIASQAPGAPRALTQVVERCLRKAPADRFPSGEALGEALARSSEQRTAIPAPVRVWLTKGEVLRPFYALWSLFTLPPIVALDPDALWMVGGPILLHTAFRLYELRRILAAGYGVDDIRLGLRAQLEQRKEELAFDFAREPFILARAARLGTFVTLAGAAGAVVGAFVLPQRAYLEFWVNFFVAMVGFSVVGAGAGLMFPGKPVSKSEIGELRLRFWDSKAGRLFARIASFRLRPRESADSQVHRPTELAIGLAADRLFDDLPKPVREQLREVPPVLRRLETEAQTLRKRLGTLDESIAALASDAARPMGSLAGSLAHGGGDAGAVGAQRQDVSADLHRARDDAAARLSTTVAALESIRLDLLRLQAGVSTPETLTAVLDAARRIGNDVDLAVQAIAGGGPLLREPARPPALSS